jgi:thiol-disulfide isomerase/thioredoxin
MRENHRSCWAFVTGVAVVVASSALAVHAESQPAVAAVAVAGPKIQVDEVTHDFGTFWAAGPLSHAFKVTNAGSAVLKITAVSPTCGCTSVGSYPHELQPGESGQFSFNLNATMLHGRFDKLITVTSNDPATPSLALHLAGECRRYVEVTPQIIFFGRLTEQTPQTRMVEIKNGSQTPLKLQLDTPTDGPFRFELTELTPGQTYQLKATLNPPFPLGQLQATAKLTTNIEAQKTLTVDVAGRSPERIEVQPVVAMLAVRSPAATQPAGQGATASGGPAASEPAAELTAQVILMNNGSTPVRLKEAVADDPKISVTATESQTPKGYRIEIHAPAGYQTPPAGRSILLRLDDAEKPWIIVPVRSYPVGQGATATVEQLVGKPAPYFAMTTAAGRTVSKAGQAGKVTVLDFFSPTCPFCKKQMPRLDVIRKAYEPQGVQFVYVSESVGAKVWTPDEVGQILKGNNVEGDFALDPANAMGQRFAATGYPTLVVIGQDGKVAAITTGNKADLEQRVKSQLDPLLGKSPSGAAGSQPAGAQTSAR